MGFGNNPTSDGKSRPSLPATSDTGKIAEQSQETFGPQPAIPNLLPLQDYFLRVREVAREVSAIIAKTTIPKDPPADGKCPLELRRAGTQIEASGALALQLVSYEALGTEVRLINLATPIGAILLFKPKDAISSTAYDEINQRFGLSPHPGEPNLFLFGRDTSGTPFNQECNLTSPGTFMNNDESLKYWRLFENP